MTKRMEPVGQHQRELELKFVVVFRVFEVDDKQRRFARSSRPVDMLIEAKLRQILDPQGNMQENVDGQGRLQIDERSFSLVEVAPRAAPQQVRQLNQSVQQPWIFEAAQQGLFFSVKPR